MAAVWFDLIGFRIPVLVHHRSDESDRLHVTPEPDVAYLSKFDFDAPSLTHPLTAEAFVLDLPTFDPVGTLLATPGGIGPSHGGLPIFVGGGGLIDCCAITRPGLLPQPGEGTPDHELPPIAAVPLSGSGLFLASAFAALPLAYIMRRILK
ncbi:hypothetical protein [Paracoccus hibiscisoli]|uniref:Uncharacterized protein n=1 Tax=Paracoccus hibiscisoli TaxID=2023261 RepID=A0A4U0RCB8_9RHOB|nr:hypothetical protein [Paracoccus hibiscisoli]TJZ85804.1 hypothetical protein FA740_05235 [Paracoccus hibiscisoli]